MSVDDTTRVGVFSPNDNRPWVRSENLDLMLRHEELLVDALRREGIEVIRGGDGFVREDQIAWNRDLVVRQARRIAEARPHALILNQGSWTFPRDSLDAVDVYEGTVRAFLDGAGEAAARILLFGYKDPQVPGLVAVMAVAGALKMMGRSYQISYGLIDKDRSALQDLVCRLRFLKRRADAEEDVARAIARLPEQKYLQFGGESLRMPTATADPNLWQKVFKVSYDHLDQSAIVDRALAFVRWSGRPGESDYDIVDERVRAAIAYKESVGRFDFSRPKLPSIAKFVMQTAIFYAARDIMEETGATFCGIKCQDELSANICTACVATSYLGNDVAPDGSKQERMFPTSCENDMDTALTQLLLHMLTGRPAGFGDFRDVEAGILAVVNCGQHPCHFFGSPAEDPVEKEKRAEFMGQEVFYHAGGSTVRGRTPGGLVVTVARLGRENLRYYLAATVMRTVDVEAGEHERYNFSWPIMRGRVPVEDRELIAKWPSNHLAFAFGDLTSHLAELCERLGIGYWIVDDDGNRYERPT